MTGDLTIDSKTHLLLSPRDTEDGRKLGAAAAARGWLVTTMERWRIPSDMPLDGKIVLYGEPLFCRVVAAQCGHVLLEPPHEWLCGVPAQFTQRQIRYLNFGQVADLDYPLFLKPPDDKIFGAAVYHSAEALVARKDIDSDQGVLASARVDFLREYRVYMLDHKAVACSVYSVNGELFEDPKDPDLDTAAHFASQVAAACTETTPSAVVIDVGVLSTGEWAVVEANPVFGAGIYGAEPDHVLDVLYAACHRQAGLDPNLEPFIFAVELD